MSNSLFSYLKERGYVYQSTNEVAVKNLMDSGKSFTFYLGIDPTADSLHIGHFFALMMFRHLQVQGHRGILVIGGATALIGDPTGKSDMRRMITKEVVARNIKEVEQLASRFIITNGNNPAVILNNSDWHNGYSYVDFMREVGVHFNVNKMLASDVYSKRLENGGLTFLEMGYMLMQAYDFLYLNKKYNCILQIGGSDQWGNIVAGTELSRKINFHNEGKSSLERPDIFGLTCPLLLTKDGKKMGKTESGTLWVARDKTTPYSFYQYFYNVSDEDVQMLLNLFTNIPVDEISELCKSDIIGAKRRMAYEVTKLVHGEDEAIKAVDASKALFQNGNNFDDVPSIEIERTCLGMDKKIIDFVCGVGFFQSKGEARRMIAQGGFVFNGRKILDINELICFNDLKNASIILQSGKKKFLRVVFK